MTVKLLHNTPLWVASKAIRKCWASEDRSDTEVCYGGDLITGSKDKELIHRVGNKNKHKSTLEHLVYTFDIDGISRACLQELARHRVASYSVKSTRYTLKELRDEDSISESKYKYIVKTKNEDINRDNMSSLFALQLRLQEGVSNDLAKYCIPEAYKTSLVMTINARALQNFLELRTSKSALWEIQDLARAMYEVLPEEHKYLFIEFVAQP